VGQKILKKFFFFSKAMVLNFCSEKIKFSKNFRFKRKCFEIGCALNGNKNLKYIYGNTQWFIIACFHIIAFCIYCRVNAHFFYIFFKKLNLNFILIEKILNIKK
jgi:hypothetical protein